MTRSEDPYDVPLQTLMHALVEAQPVYGVAMHRLITDAQGHPVDYVFIAVNRAFESLTGLERTQIIGKPVTTVLPNLSGEEFDWIGTYGRVVQQNETTTFEQYAASLGRWYRVTAYCPEPPYFVTVVQDITEHKAATETFELSASYYAVVFEHMSEGLAAHAIVYDAAGTATDYRILDVNPGFERILGARRDEVVGRLASDVYGVPAFLDIYASVAETLEPQQFDAPFGEHIYAVRTVAPRRGEFVTMFFDVTEERRRVAAQQATLRELSTPLIPIAQGIVVLPLIGNLDPARVQRVQETLLEGVVEYQASTVILDITGVQHVDSATANGFAQVAQAVRLLGAQVMMTGIQPQIAQTMIQLGVELSGITTYSTLQAGIAAVLQLSA